MHLHLVIAIYFFFAYFVQVESKQAYNETLIVFTQVSSWILKRLLAVTVATYCENYWTRFGLDEFRFRFRFRRIPMKAKCSERKARFNAKFMERKRTRIRLFVVNPKLCTSTTHNICHEKFYQVTQYKNNFSFRRKLFVTLFLGGKMFFVDWLEKWHLKIAKARLASSLSSTVCYTHDVWRWMRTWWWWALLQSNTNLWIFFH